MTDTAQPREILSVADAIAIMVGMVVGAGIFKTSAIVAAMFNSEAMRILFRRLRGLISCLGALYYAERTASCPHSGGDYHSLQKAFGRLFLFLFAWSRMALIQTGSIATIAFLIGHYASTLFPPGSDSSAIYATATVVMLTAVNILGLRQGSWNEAAFVPMEGRQIKNT